MERDSSRKRTRDEEDEKIEHKKQEAILPLDLRDEEGCAATVGIFDFPWLKEGAFFGAYEFLDPQDLVTPCSCMDETKDTSVANLDQSCFQNSLVLPLLDQNFHNSKFDGDGLLSIQVDDLEPLDYCIWSCVIDQPLHNICTNKV